MSFSAGSNKFHQTIVVENGKLTILL